ncbi:hypothetical protein L9Z41_17260 [Leptospira noguchii]|uniref:hypothetical protein n=1 Tax=Leptospira noguchii TaxID=28182 RepID=UPI001F052DAC|nr:hypothetical protein [Leptospira noguchii]MCH1911853.1 hypothetical protein [Leptospira noguchii]MCH1917330.1 hypothetical protein [Leptospira noguchii]UOG63011.1 hypothetical protein MAL04_11395 [Leptospira noguchii]
MSPISEILGDVLPGLRAGASAFSRDLEDLILFKLMDFQGLRIFGYSVAFMRQSMIYS